MLVTLAVVLVIVAVLLWGVWSAEPTIASIEDMVRARSAWGAIVSIGLMIIHSFVPFPAELVAIANGMVFGLVWGTIITWTGAMLGAQAAFGLTRYLGRPFVVKVVARRQREKLDEWTLRTGAGVLVLSRFIPLISFNLINYAAGLTNMSWWTFTWATGLGILPLTFLMVAMGSGMTSSGGEVWLWLLAIVAITSIGWLVSRRPAVRRATGAALRGASTALARSAERRLDRELAPKDDGS